MNIFMRIIKGKYIVFAIVTLTVLYLQSLSHAEGIGGISSNIIHNIDSFSPDTSPTQQAEEQNKEGEKFKEKQEQNIKAFNKEYNRKLYEIVDKTRPGSMVNLKTKIIATEVETLRTQYGASHSSYPRAGGISLDRPGTMEGGLSGSFVLSYDEGSNTVYLTNSSSTYVFKSSLTPDEIGVVYNAVFNTPRQGVYFSMEGTGRVVSQADKDKMPAVSMLFEGDVVYQGDIDNTTIGNTLFKADMLFGELAFGFHTDTGMMFKSTVPTYRNSNDELFKIVNNPTSQQYATYIENYKTFRSMGYVITLTTKEVVFKKGMTNQKGEITLIPQHIPMIDVAGIYTDWYGNTYYDEKCKICETIKVFTTDMGSNYPSYEKTYPVFNKIMDIAIMSAFFRMVNDASDRFTTEQSSKAKLMDLNKQAKSRGVKTPVKWTQHTGKYWQYYTEDFKDYGLAMEKLLLEILKDTGLNEIKQSAIWLEIGDIRLTYASYNDAVTAYKKTVELEQDMPDYEQSGLALLKLSLIYLDKNQFKDFHTTIMKAISVFRGRQDEIHLATAYRLLGNEYVIIGNIRNQLEKEKNKEPVGTLFQLGQHLKILEEIKRNKLLKDNGKFIEARENLLKLLKDVNDPIDRATINHLIGVTYILNKTELGLQDDHRWNMAMTYLSKSLVTYNKYKRYVEMGNVYGSISAIYEVRSMMILEKQLISIFKRANELTKEKRWQECIDIIYDSMNKIDKLNSLFGGASGLYDGVKSQAYMYLVFSYNGLGKYFNAFEWAMRAMDYYKNSGDSKKIALIENMLKTLKTKIGR
ncbi:MAG: hypothetical protein HQL00_16685 [Nitrospirae bacterium]|nr:hypothetical protein [Nitrospirota bacterium]